MGAARATYLVEPAPLEKLGLRAIPPATAVDRRIRTL